MRTAIKNIVDLRVLGILLIISLCGFNEQSLSQAPQKNVLKLKLPRDQMVSALGIALPFAEYKTNDVEDVYLLVSGTYNTSLIEPEKYEGAFKINLPPQITSRAGVVAWRLIQNEQTVQHGSFRLLPDTLAMGKIENYLGPRSITANDRDYTMLVSIPTDTLDNFLPDHTAISLNSQFNQNINKTTVRLKHNFAWQRIPAPLKTGRISTGSTLGKIASKELIADVFPDLPQDFNITAQAHHYYADGNELITFKTSQITDAHGNIMTDGTLVTFFMTNEHGRYWEVNANTINGYAFAKALHPEQPTTWKVEAAIKGMAKTSPIMVKFSPIIDKIPLFINSARSLTVGPLTSYLGQLVQDGIHVQIVIKGKSHSIYTHDGAASLALPQDQFPPGTYKVGVSTLGLKTSKEIILR